MRALRELAGVIVAGFVAFFGGILMLFGVLILWLMGLASALCLMVAAFAGMMYCFTGKPHDGQIALGYLGYAAVPFVLAFVFHYYRGKLGEGRPRQTAVRRIDQQALERIGSLRLERDEDFTPSVRRH